MRHVNAIFKKQMKETVKNAPVLIQFIMFPAMTLIMKHAVHIEGMPQNYFVTLFAGMFMGMAPLTSISAIIAEEKEKNTLRVLRMSNVKPWEYLLGVGSYVLLCCFLGAAVITFSGTYHAHERAVFLLIMIVGILSSLLFGAAVGTLSKNQITATSLTIPLMMIFSFLPMLSMFNSQIEKIGKFIYTVQLQNMILNLQSLELKPSVIVILAGNMLVAACLFVFAYRKSEFA